MRRGLFLMRMNQISMIMSRAGSDKHDAKINGA